MIGYRRKLADMDKLCFVNLSQGFYISDMEVQIVHLPTNVYLCGGGGDPFIWYIVHLAILS